MNHDGIHSSTVVLISRSWDYDTLPKAILVASEEALGIEHLNIHNHVTTANQSAECVELFVVEGAGTATSSGDLKWRSIHPNVPVNVIDFPSVGHSPIFDISSDKEDELVVEIRKTAEKSCELGRAQLFDSKAIYRC